MVSGRTSSRPLVLEPATCCLCERNDAARPVAVGEDFEYRTCPDSFVAYRCDRCDLVYLNPRPAREESSRLYPDHYHAFEFSRERYGLIHRVRSQLEWMRLKDWCGQLPPGSRVLDVGAGDGFHLGLLREFGDPTWDLSGIDSDVRAAGRARERGLDVREGFFEELDPEPESIDFLFMIQTIEHVSSPTDVLRVASRALKPGGSLGIVTDNIESIDSRFGRSRHWGGYHFPRHWNLFSRRSLTALAAGAGLETERVTTMTSPVNWTYTVRNWLDDWGARRDVVSAFSLESPIAMGFFTVVDSACRVAGSGALLRGLFRKPGRRRS